MSKTKVSVSKKQLAQTGEDLEAVGTMAEVAGAVEVADKCAGNKNLNEQDE